MLIPYGGYVGYSIRRDKVPKVIAPLTVRRVEQLSKLPGLHAVGGVKGLYVQVEGAGVASWILRIVIGDARRALGLGSYTEVTLDEAREKARRLRKQIAEGVDPLAAKRDAVDALRASNAKRMTFAEAARKVINTKRAGFKNAKHLAQWTSTLTTYAFPVVGQLPVDRIELAHIANVLGASVCPQCSARVMEPDRPKCPTCNVEYNAPIWTAKAETASRVRGRIEDVLKWATLNGYRTGENPATFDKMTGALGKQMSKSRRVQHHKAYPWRDVGAFMANLRTREALTARALEFLILTASRSGEVRLAPWSEFDLRAKVWTIPKERMKGGKEHKVPLCDAAVKLLKSLPRFVGSPYVFPAPRCGALSDNAFKALLDRMDVNVTTHGFRSSFKDWARSSTRYDDEVSELALAHVDSDATRSAYARDELLPLRTLLMADWATYCDQPSNVVALHSSENVQTSVAN